MTALMTGLIGYGGLLGLSGWLLLAPPEIPGHGEGASGFNVNAPLDRWRQVEAFDTATGCESEKNNRFSQALKEVEVLLPYPPLPEHYGAQPSPKEAAQSIYEITERGLVKVYPPAPPPKSEAPPQGQTTPQDKKLRQEGLDKDLEDEPAPTLLEQIRALDRPTIHVSPSLIENIRSALARPHYVTEQAWREWTKEKERIDAAREPKQRAVNERYRLWKCVPADAVYRVPK